MHPQFYTNLDDYVVEVISMDNYYMVVRNRQRDIRQDCVKLSAKVLLNNVDNASCMPRVS